MDRNWSRWAGIGLLLAVILAGAATVAEVELDGMPGGLSAAGDRLFALAGGVLRAYDLEPPDLQTRAGSVPIAQPGLLVAHGNANPPVVPGHEVAGTIVAVGERVGLGWHATYCLHGAPCRGGDHNLCASSQATIVGHHGDSPIGCTRRPPA